MKANQLHQRLIAAAQQHGSDSDPDHEVGDLQELLQAALQVIEAHGAIDDYLEAITVSMEAQPEYDWLPTVRRRRRPAADSRPRQAPLEPPRPT